MIRLENVSKFYYTKGVIAVGFSKVSLNFDVGEFVAITGESGSGKSTLLNVISGLDTYEEGEMYINGEETSHYTEKDFEDYRRTYIGNIFQNFNLVNSYTVYQNIALVMQLNGSSGKEIKARVDDLIEKVGLTQYRNTKASKLSGGQKQRVAIARALAKDTPIIIADEPTGNLDSESAAGIIELLSQIAKDKLVIIVTHNYDQVEPYITRKIKMHDGKVLEDTQLKQKAATETPAISLDDEPSFKNIRFGQKLKLGVRNAFNIPVKFLILTFVFIFATVVLTSQLGSFQEEIYESDTSGYNYIFNNASIKRIVLKKLDGNGVAQSFTEEDIKQIESVTNVDEVIEQDLLVDSSIYLYTKNYYYSLSGNVVLFSDYSDITPDYGRMPTADDEILVIATTNNYYFDADEDCINEQLFKEEYYLEGEDSAYKVVGVKFMEADEDPLLSSHGILICGSEKLLNKILIITNKNYSKTYVTVGSSDRVENEYGYPNYTLQFSEKVEEGTAWISEIYSGKFKNGKAVGGTVKIDVENVYYSDSLELTVAGVYNEKQFGNFYAFTNDWQTYEGCNGFIFINPNDYNSLFAKETYQISVFVEDDKIVEETAEELEKLGFDTLVLKNTLILDDELAILQVLSYAITFGLAIVLLLISYFVIRIVLKSRNVYYSTIRMLGANTRVCRELLIIDMLVDANIAYLISMVIFRVLYEINPKLELVAAVFEFVSIPQFVCIYLIIVLIALVISIRYANKLFKKSTMVTIKEEV